MASSKPSEPPPASPWRPVFETVRRSVGNQRDEDGVLGSINWLRRNMERRGANPNVVRNIIYRDKGRLPDKRVLFQLLGELWQKRNGTPLEAPELEVLLGAGANTEQEVLQVLGREKRRAYQSFVSRVRNGASPKLLISGKAGSGKTLLLDYIQQALEIGAQPDNAVTRLEFSSSDLAGTLTRLAVTVGVPSEAIEAKLVKIGTSSAYSVQADAQAEVARVIIDALRHQWAPQVLLLHLSQGLSEVESLGLAPLRLNTPDVPRVNGIEWLWLALFEPISHLEHISVLASMAAVPARALQQLGAFEGPVKLSPPSVNEARRFVRARLPQLSAVQQEALVKRSGRSFEELRTLTLLAEIREPIAESGAQSDKHLVQLSALVDSSGDDRLRDFLGALAVLSMPEFPSFSGDALASLRRSEWRELSSVEQSFLDATPGKPGSWRCFSRQLARLLRRRLAGSDARRYRQLNSRAARHLWEAAQQEPTSDAAARYLHHLFEARDWVQLEQWLSRHAVRQSLLRRLWRAAGEELPPGDPLERIAQEVAAHYVRLGSYEHPDAVAAFALLSASGRAEFRAWAQLKRAEGAVLRGRFEQAESLLEHWPDIADPLLKADFALVKASLLRWRGRLVDAAQLVEKGARSELPNIPANPAAGKLTHIKVAAWAGLIAKDQGDLPRALTELQSIAADDDLIRARLAFQQGDIQLKLGRFGAAEEALTEAVNLSRQGEAPPAEQARYLARRGSLKRKIGALVEAGQDFQAALGALEPEDDTLPAGERAFERAKVQDEYSLQLIAEGRFDDAVFTLKRNLDEFRRYQRRHRIDAGFRIMRSTLRLALAYWSRGCAQPYRMPLNCTRRAGEQPDRRHARALVDKAIGKMQTQAGGRSRFGPLYRQALFLGSLFSDSEEQAERRALAALRESRYSYDKAWCHCLVAVARMSACHPEYAIRHIDEARACWERARLGAGPDEPGDAGLAAWLVALELRARIRLDEPSIGADRLICALNDPAFTPHHEALLRMFGEAIEASGLHHWLKASSLPQRLGIQCDDPLQQVRLPDALIKGWQDRHASRPGG